jgi:hypothetical protein
MKSFKTTSILSLSLAAAVLALPGTASAQILFSDDFNTAGSAANYSVATAGQTAVTWAYDYSAMGIPVAPNTTDGSTLGVKFEANMSLGAAAGVTLHTIQQFTGPYIVKFDAWINANGPFPAGGTGSTEFLTAGVGGNGTTVNRVGGTGVGGYVAVDGEGGSTIDYRLYKGVTLQDPASGQYAAGTHATARNVTNAYYSQFGGVNVADLPVQGVNNGGPAQQTGTTLTGSFGFEWHEVELHVNPFGGTGGAASVAWYIDGLLIGTLDAGIGASFAATGSVTVGYADPFASLSDNATLSFGLIDNLVVIPEPSTFALGVLGLVGMYFARRRKD